LFILKYLTVFSATFADPSILFLLCPFGTMLLCRRKVLNLSGR